MTIEQKIRGLVKDYAKKLNGKMDARGKKMEDDDHSHFLIYRVLGVTTQEGKMIDVYQNKSRFVYKYAGSLLEQATKLCFKEMFLESGSAQVSKPIGQRHLKLIV